MPDTKFIGRGEMLSAKILLKLIDCVAIQSQVNIKGIISKTEYDILDHEIQNHNFDFVIRRNNKKDVIVEINYHHKEKAGKKWNKIFIPLLEKANYDYVTVNDYDCRDHGLFWLDSKKEHENITWDDFRDIIDALEIAGITPHVNLFDEN